MPALSSAAKMARCLACCFTVLATALAPAGAAAGQAAVAEFQRSAYAADFQAGIGNLKAMTEADPGDVEAAFAIGGLEFLRALATLQEGLYRHSGTSATAASDLRGLTPLMPFGLGFSAPVLLPPNPQAVPMTYPALRAILKQFVDDLATAEVSLARVGERAVKLPLQPMQIALDLDHDGKIAPSERLLGALFGRGQTAPTFHLDTADASWLRGYANLMMASANLLLAFDFEKSYEAVAHNAYGPAATAFGREMQKQSASPRAARLIEAEIAVVDAKLAATSASFDQTQLQILRSRLAALPRTPETADERRKLQEEQRELQQQQQRHFSERNDLQQEKQRLAAELAGQPPGATYASVLDVIAAVHTLSWTVVEPDRMKAVRTHLLQVMAINRTTWRLARSETDDDHEWLPNAKQTSPFGARQLTDGVIDSWLATTALAEQVLNGEKLLPHPRFRKGINMRLFFETARNFDLVMLITGHGLPPYLQDGDVVEGRAWRELTQPMQQNFWMYAAWFN